MFRKTVLNIGYQLFTTPIGGYGYQVALATFNYKKKAHSMSVVIPINDHANLHVIPFFWDNYCYVIEEKGKGVAVDPADYETVSRYCKENGIELVAVVCTHHHADHSYGNYYAKLDGIFVYGSEDSPYVDLICKDGEKVVIKGLKNVEMTPILAPFHTRDHLCYLFHIKDGNFPIFCSGDCLFICGIGKFFEIDKEDDVLTAMDKLKRIVPHEALLLCGHEYTVRNMEFSLQIEPFNTFLQDKLKWAQEMRKNQLPTVGNITFGDDMKMNPFLRSQFLVQNSELKQIVHTEVEVLTYVRKMKDRYSQKSDCHDEQS